MMPRILYKATCDKCNKDIPSPNEENDVAFNSAKYIYCFDCYHNLIALWELWDTGQVPVKDNVVKECITQMTIQMDKHGIDHSNNPSFYKAVEKTEQYFGVKK